MGLPISIGNLCGTLALWWPLSLLLLKVAPPSSEAEIAFLELKRSFRSAPVLSIPDPELPFIVEVDASDVGIGAVLSHRGKNDRLHPCAFLSYRLSPTERNYQVGDQELLAVKLALEEWRHWLEGAKHPLQVLNDHKNLEYIQQAKRLNPRQARWSLFFNRFDFILSFRPGSKNLKPDTLSRVYAKVSREDAPCPIIPAARIVAPVRWALETTVRQAQTRESDPGGGPENRLYIPKSVRAQVLQWAHTSLFACHPGISRTLEFLQRRFWWPAVKTEVTAFVKDCPVCNQSKTSHLPPQGLLYPLPIPQFLSLKTLLLTALASIKRVGDLHNSICLQTAREGRNLKGS